MGHFARGIEQRLNEIPRARTISPERRAAIAHGLAGNLFSLLTWWVQHGMTSPPEEMDKLFHTLVWKARRDSAPTHSFSLADSRKPDLTIDDGSAGPGCKGVGQDFEASRARGELRF